MNFFIYALCSGIAQTISLLLYPLASGRTVRLSGALGYLSTTVTDGEISKGW